MTRVILDRARQARLTFTASRLHPRFRCGALQPASTAREEMHRGTTFDADLVAQLPVLRCYADRLSRDREEATDLVQDACERALRFRHLFHEGTSLRAWVLTIMRHRFLDTAKRRRDAMESGQRVPLDEFSEWAQSDARAETSVM